MTLQKHLPKAVSKGLLSEIIVLDMVFSIDSIITAVGMVEELWVMYAAVVTTVVIMLFASKPISAFIPKTPFFQDTCAVFFDDDWRIPDCGGLPCGDSKGIYLLRNGVCVLGGRDSDENDKNTRKRLIYQPNLNSK